MAEVPVGLHLGLIGVLGGVVTVSQVGQLARHPRQPTAGRGTARLRPWREPRLLLIGVVVLAMGLGEGTAVDWLPLVMVDGHDTSAATGSAVFAGFAACMAAGRFSGGRFVDRLGPTRAVRWTAAAAVLGIGLVAAVDSLAVTAVAVALWGLGISLGFPVAMSAAGDSGPDSAARVSFVATMGYVSFLAGPPSLGFLGERLGLRTALLAPMLVIAGAALLAPAVDAGSRTRRRHIAVVDRPGG
jgi:fucose permease